MKRSILLGLLLLVVPVAVQAQIVNGDFSDGLNGWTVVQPAPSKPGTAAFAPAAGPASNPALLTPAHGWQIHAFNEIATFLVAGTETPTEEGHITQVFSCGDAGDDKVCRITVDYRLLHHLGSPEAARIKIYIDGFPIITDGTISETLDFIPGEIFTTCGEHEIKLCLEVDTGISSWTANFDNVVAECVDEVPVEPSTWGMIKTLARR